MIYKQFKIKDIFTIRRGDAKGIRKKQIDPNGINCISAKDDNNGMYIKTLPEINETVYEKVITINNNGSIGHAYWQEEPFIASSDVSILLPLSKYQTKINKYSALYFIPILFYATTNYSYGLKLSNTRLSNLSIPLPSIDNEIDFDSMEKFIKKIYYKKKKLTKNKTVNNSTNKQTKIFLIKDLFEVTRGKRIVQGRDYFKERTNEFCYPVITARTSNNSVDGYYNQCNCEGNSIVCGGEASGMFATYQEEKCWVMDRSRIFVAKNNMKINKYIAIYIVTLLRQNCFKYSYNRSANPNNIMETKIELPINNKGLIDFDYMEKFIKSLPYGDLL